MSRIKKIIIDFTDLTDSEQVDLLFELFHFAQAKLPHDKNLIINVEEVK